MCPQNEIIILVNAHIYQNFKPNVKFLFQQQQRQQASTYETKAVSSSSTAAASQGRRRTWAESSAAFTGDSFAFGGGTDSMRTRLVAGKLVAASSVAQQRATTTVHEQPCPAHGIFKDTSGFKFDRQTSSGHRLFMPTVSN